MRRQYNKLSDNKTRTFYARQDKIILNGMEKTLSKRGAQLLNYLVLSLIFVVLGILIVEMFFYEQLKTSGWLLRLFAIDLFACCVFLFEFCLGWYHADDKGWYWRHHWIDFVSSIPVPYPEFVNIERWGRLLRLIRVFRLWRAMRIIAFAYRGIKMLEKNNIRIIELSIVFIVIITIIGSAVIIQLEGTDLVRHMEKRQIQPIQTEEGLPKKSDISTAKRFEEGIWWTLNTVTTGGFADLYQPKTVSARMLTAFLILVGAGLITVFTATVTSLFLGQEAEELRDTQDMLLSRHAELVESFGKLQKSVRDLNNNLK